MEWKTKLTRSAVVQTINRGIRVVVTIVATVLLTKCIPMRGKKEIMRHMIRLGIMNFSLDVRVTR